MEKLTLDDVLYKINNFNKSGIFLTEKSFVDFLSGISFDGNGTIVGAKATIMRWFNTMNSTEALLNPG